MTQIGQERTQNEPRVTQIGAARLVSGETPRRRAERSRLLRPSPAPLPAGNSASATKHDHAAPGPRRPPSGRAHTAAAQSTTLPGSPASPRLDLVAPLHPAPWSAPQRRRRPAPDPAARGVKDPRRRRRWPAFARSRPMAAAREENGGVGAETVALGFPLVARGSDTGERKSHYLFVLLPDMRSEQINPRFSSHAIAETHKQHENLTWLSRIQS
jgi:hypothetical protein